MVEEIDRGVEAPFQRFQSGTVWTGPTATLFGEQLALFRSRARASGGRIIDELRTALGRTPAEVTEEEAALIKRRYGLP
ncbi:MAG TPA: hypothetical protein VFV66_17985 [Nonomuraea sp.]|nr:hypothetical protein [Nonomuraea sp.]